MPSHTDPIFLDITVGQEANAPRGQYHARVETDHALINSNLIDDASEGPILPLDRQKTAGNFAEQ